MEKSSFNGIQKYFLKSILAQGVFGKLDYVVNFFLNLLRVLVQELGLIPIPNLSCAPEKTAERHLKAVSLRYGFFFSFLLVVFCCTKYVQFLFQIIVMMGSFVDNLLRKVELKSNTILHTNEEMIPLSLSKKNLRIWISFIVKIGRLHWFCMKRLTEWGERHM